MPDISRQSGSIAFELVNHISESAAALDVLTDITATCSCLWLSMRNLKHRAVHIQEGGRQQAQPLPSRSPTDRPQSHNAQPPSQMRDSTQ